MKMNRRLLLLGATSIGVGAVLPRLWFSKPPSYQCESSEWVRVWHNPLTDWPVALPPPGVYRLAINSQQSCNNLFFIDVNGLSTAVPRSCIEGMAPLGVNLEVGDTIEVTAENQFDQLSRKVYTVLERRDCRAGVDEGKYEYRLDRQEDKYEKAWFTDAVLAMASDLNHPAYLNNT